MSRRFFHFLCIALLLAAQHGALVHATWHAASHVPAPVCQDDADACNGYDQQSPPRHGGQSSLCAFDLAFGQMLGGVHGSCALPAVAELAAAIAGYTFNPRLGTEAVPAHSRGPPVFL